MKKYVVCIALVHVLFMGCNNYDAQREAERVQLYQAWTNCYGKTVSYTNWCLLYEKDMLPGQDVKAAKAAEDAANRAAGMAAFSAVMSAGKR